MSTSTKQKQPPCLANRTPPNPQSSPLPPRQTWKLPPQLATPNILPRMRPARPNSCSTIPKSCGITHQQSSTRPTLQHPTPSLASCPIRALLRARVGLTRTQWEASSLWAQSAFAVARASNRKSIVVPSRRWSPGALICICRMKLGILCPGRKVLGGFRHRVWNVSRKINQCLYYFENMLMQLLDCVLSFEYFIL